MNIGENITMLRKNKGLTQEELANYINVSPKTISSYETGRSLPNLEILISLSHSLDTNIDNILGLTNDNKTLIKEKYHQVEQKNSLLKLLFLIVIFIIPIIYFVTEYTTFFEAIIAKYQHTGIFDVKANVELFLNFKYEIIKVYFMYSVIVFISYLLFSLKKKIFLGILASLLLVMFIIDLLTGSNINSLSLFTSLLPFFITLVLAIKCPKKVPSN